MVVKQYTRRIDDAGRIEKVQSLTDASTEAVTNYGVTTIANTSGDKTFAMEAPTQGLVKTLVVDSQSTGTITVVNKSTGTTFYGSTGNTLVFSTGGAAGRVVNLLGVSTSQWAITGGFLLQSATLALTTAANAVGLTISASTVST